MVQRALTGSMVPTQVRNRRWILPMSLGIHEARRAGSSLAQAAGLGMDVMECQRPVGPRFPFNSSCFSPALQAGGIFVCRFPRALPWAKGSRAFGAGSWSQLTSGIGGVRSP